MNYLEPLLSSTLSHRLQKTPTRVIVTSRRRNQCTRAAHPPRVSAFAREKVKEFSGAVGAVPFPSPLRSFSPTLIPLTQINTDASARARHSCHSPESSLAAQCVHQLIYNHTHSRRNAQTQIFHSTSQTLSLCWRRRFVEILSRPPLDFFCTA